jgi:hypothetical protein
VEIRKNPRRGVCLTGVCYLPLPIKVECPLFFPFSFLQPFQFPDVRRGAALGEERGTFCFMGKRFGRFNSEAQHRVRRGGFSPGGRFLRGKSRRFVRVIRYVWIEKAVAIGKAGCRCLLTPVGDVTTVGAIADGLDGGGDG